MIWFTADLHLGHGNIIKYCHRPFLTDREQERLLVDPAGLRVSRQTVEKHDAALLRAINSRVKPDDELWIVGDFCMSRDEDAAARYRDRIGCRKVHLVWGNHDPLWIERLFDRVVDDALIQIEDQSIWLHHYPRRDWPMADSGGWHLYGHVHGRRESEDRDNPHLLVKDVGVDACDYRPWSFEELKQYMAPRLRAFELRKAQLAQTQADRRATSTG
jgi:calcineurin-like phosphoesterase family protein